MEVTLMEMLDARERRVNRQRELRQQYGKTMLCFTMNIAGPVKNSALIRRGFQLGMRLLEQQLMTVKARILYFEQVNEKTGNEVIYILDCSPMAAKRVAVTIEDGTEIGRLFDMDVLDAQGQKVDRQALGLVYRKCLICDNMAQACARSRVHTVEELQKKTWEILTTALAQKDAQTIARLAVQALLYEVGTTPKPGLVDRANCGSHRDMDFFTFQASAAALWPYFQKCAEIGMASREELPEQTFTKLRTPGMLAEGEMLGVTNGVNTHKGAIFSLGILCAAAGRLGVEFWKKTERLLHECAQMSAGVVSKDYADLTPETANTVGQKLYLQYGITGVRGQAEAGFPAVGKVGLPKLEEGLSCGLSMNDAGCAALLAMMASTVDTNIIHRSDYETQQRIALDTAILLQKKPFPEEGVLQAMDKDFIHRNISPGGTADLLAMVYLLHFLKEELS